MRGKHRQPQEPDEQCVGVQEAEEAAREVHLVVERQAAKDVADGHAEQEGGNRAAQRKGGVPGLPPARRVVLAPELHGDRAEDQPAQDKHEGQVEAAEHRGVDVRKGREDRAAASQQPHLVPVPYRPDGVQEGATVLVSPGKQVPDADPQIEAVEDRIAGQQNADEQEPCYL